MLLSTVFACVLMISAANAGLPTDTEESLHAEMVEVLVDLVNYLSALKPSAIDYRDAMIDMKEALEARDFDAIKQEFGETRRLANRLGYQTTLEQCQSVQDEFRRLVSRSDRRIQEAEEDRVRIEEFIGQLDIYWDELVDAIDDPRPYPCYLDYEGAGTVYFNFEGICYKLGSEEVGFDEARTLCQAEGADLATIDSAAKDNFLIDVLDEHGLTAANDWPVYWFGGRKDANGAFRWISNNQLVDDGYTHWNTGEPNNSGGEEDCMHYWVFPTWNDARCTYVQRYICEFY